MIKKVDHLGIAVKDLAAALQFYQEALGLQSVHTEVVEDQGVRVAMIPIGESRIELLEPLSPTTPVGKFIESRGEGIHHLAVEVDDVQRHLDDLTSKGVILIDKAPRSGAHGKKIAFVHPKSTRGLLLELCQD